MKIYHKFPKALLALAASGIFILTAGNVAAQAQDAGQLVFVTTGGTYQKMQEETVFGPFSKETGIKVVFVTASDAEKWSKIFAMAKVGNMQWDLFEVQPADTYDERKTSLLLEYGQNCAAVPRAYSDGIPGTCTTYGVLPAVGATLLAANKSSFANGKIPANWSDFWDVKTFPGPRSLQNFGTPWRVLVGALVADGVPKDKIFPLDIDRAFKKLDEIRPHIAMWWSTGDQIQRAFRDREIAAGQIWATRLSFLQDEGVPLVGIWDGATLNEGLWGVLKDAPNAKNAIRFLNWYYANPQAQYNYAKAIKAAPVTKSALALYPAGEQAPSFDGIIPVDYKWLGQNEARILERWNSWITR